MMYHVYMTLNDGEGMCQRVFVGEDITEFELYTSMFRPGCKMTIEYCRGE
jgi:hypothetical protein